MTMKLVYNGPVVATFMAINAELKPGDEFYVPDELVDSFLRRDDVEPAIDHGMADSDEEPDPTPIDKGTKKTAQPAEPAADAPEAKKK